MCKDKVLPLQVFFTATGKGAGLVQRDADYEVLKARDAEWRERVKPLIEALQWALDAGGWRLWYYAMPMPDIITHDGIGSHARIREEALRQLEQEPGTACPNCGGVGHSTQRPNMVCHYCRGTG